MSNNHKISNNITKRKQTAKVNKHENKVTDV